MWQKEAGWKDVQRNGGRQEEIRADVCCTNHLVSNGEELNEVSYCMGRHNCFSDLSKEFPSPEKGAALRVPHMLTTLAPGYRAVWAHEPKFHCHE